MIKCSECSYENMDGLDYCDGCGAKLVPAGDASAGASSSAPASPAAPKPEAPVEAAAPEAPAAEASKPAEAPTGEIKPETAPAAAPAGAAPSGAPATFKATLKVIRGGRKDQEFPLEDGNNLVGRWDPDTGSFPEVDLDADDPEAKISRKHALIRIADDKITVEDIGSLNGTYVNRGARLVPGTAVELKAGDEVIIGKTFLKLAVDPIS
ncbi:MAG: FHA domain-containing protein [Candidatus Binataceae bacterium]